MNIDYGQRFARSTKHLPDDILDKLGSAVILLEQNPYHPRLHTKHLRGQFAGLLSFRVTRDLPVVFRFLGKEAVQLQYITRRKDAYR